MQSQENDYKINYDKQLGKGQYGVVYECSSPNIKEPICVKILKTDQMDSKLICRESEILLKLKNADNPNLVKVYNVYHNKEIKELQLVMEKCTGGDLKQDLDNRIMQNKPYNVKEVINILSQIINGYRTLFDQLIIHRDLKPANILLNEGKIKITDFGMGRVIENMTNKYPHTKVGTPAYAAPQLYLERTYSSKSDIYSLGVILHQLVFLKLPFKAYKISDVVNFLKDLKNQPYQCGEVKIEGDPLEKNMIRQLINKMLTYNEEDRISWGELINQFCQGNNKIMKTEILKADENSQQKIYDSIFQLNQNFKQQKFNLDIFKQVAVNIPDDNHINKAVRLNHLIKLLIAKGQLAQQFSNVLFELKKNELQYMNSLNYYLIQTCLTGYIYKIIQNAYGFSFNCLQLVCDEMRQAYKNIEIEKALKEYANDNSENYQQQRNEVYNEREKSYISFNFFENQLIQCKKQQTYPADISKFYNLIAITDNTQYKIYGKWFQYFYRRDLQNLLVYDENKPYSINYLKFLVLAEMFLKIEQDYPYEEYCKKDPNKVVLPEDVDQAQLIKLLNEYRKKK